MKLFAPGYYKDFCCIADRCTHSCCIGWEIDVDSEALCKYRSLEGGYGENIMASIEMGSSPSFKLIEDGRCPHLSDRGLCNIITNLSEDYLCHICREHPRFYNATPRGMEMGLGLSCEEAARIILSSDDHLLYETGETEGEPYAGEIDPTALRDDLFRIIGDDRVPYSDRLLEIQKRHNVSPSEITDEVWRELLSGLEYLDDSDRALFSVYSSDILTKKELEKPLGRALCYFIYRHTSSTESIYDFKAALGFSLFCERLLCSAATAFDSIPLFEIARRISEELEYCEDNTDEIKTEFLF